MGATKYIFVTGGVTSSLGKGIISASVGKLLQARGLRVTIQKFDPYINVDPGTLNPYEHGECYVTDDGAETDLDLGHYERFLGVPTSQANNVTTGRIYYSVITAEREGKYLGKTVQVVPHITDEIKRRFRALGDSGDYDVIITEIGGCVGDIEALPFIEALRQFRWEVGTENIACVHLTLVPYLKAAGELKTKPTQHSVKSLLESGIQPDIVVCRSEMPLPEDIRRKVALFTNVRPDCVISSLDAETIYAVPLLMEEEELDLRLMERLGIEKPVAEAQPQMSGWKQFVERVVKPEHTVEMALVGKYVELPDAYKSINEALIHAGAANNCKVNIELVQSDDLDERSDADIAAILEGKDGILVAPGFGKRGIEGKIKAVRYARENKVPFFGICLGMQVSVIEFARNVLGLEDAHSVEMAPNCKHPVIDMMSEQKRITQLGGTMRLGAYPCELKEGSLAKRVYGKSEISERHRHRYEFNSKYLEAFEGAGMRASGLNPESGLVEIMEVENHPFFLGSQFHPELKSTVGAPGPIFVSFVAAMMERARAPQSSPSMQRAHK